MEQNPNQPLNIEISEEIAEGTYANLAIITHSNAELKSRVILTPMHAKRFMKAMVENIERYEAAHGPIGDMEQIEIPMNFGGPTAQA